MENQKFYLNRHGKYVVLPEQVKKIKFTQKCVRNNKNLSKTKECKLQNIGLNTNVKKHLCPLASLIQTC